MGREGNLQVKLSELHFELPGELIAQRPAEPRDASRLLVLHRASGKLEHRAFRDIIDYLEPGDCLTLNDTRVVPARFFCRKQTGGRIEALYLHQADDSWQVLLKPAARLKPRQRLNCGEGESELVLLERLERGQWLVRPEPETDAFGFLKRVGQTPLPPYICRDPKPDLGDKRRYQTVYARQPGAVAAPTAGLHFTTEVLERIREAGVRVAHVTLHVGIGTFAPITVEDISRHQMHAEYYEIGAATLETLSQTRAAGSRIVAVGTTSARVLESLPALGEGLSESGDRSGWTDIFIYPPYRFKNVDLLLTNFHLPGSSLIALVMAMAGKELVRTSYAAAIERSYRFYSYGDAMLIL